MLSQGCGPAAKSAFDQMCTLVGYDHVWICAIDADKKMLSDKSDNFQTDLKTVFRCIIPSLSSTTDLPILGMFLRAHFAHV